jgi:hypothetical protein
MQCVHKKFINILLESNMKKQNRNQNRYVCVPRKVFDVGISRKAIVLFAALCVFRNSATNQCHPAQGTLAKMCCMGVDTVRAAIRELERAGIVAVYHRHMMTSVYTLKFDSSDGYFKVPVRIFDADTNTVTKAAWMYLARLGGGGCTCYSYRKEIARRCRISISSVDRARRALARLCLLEVMPRFAKAGNQIANVFTLLLRPGAATQSSKTEYDPELSSFTPENRFAVLF